MKELETERAKILSITYNCITIKPFRKPIKNIYFDGLQKRVLADVKFNTKNIDLEYTINTQFWETGINFIELCDICKDDVNNLVFDINDKHKCGNCGIIVCSDCFDIDNNLCSKCIVKKVVIVL